MRRLARVAFWATLLGVAVATLGPIELRPETGVSASAERFLAFASLGGLLALAYPRFRVASLVLLVAAAGLLEALQNDVPGRHGRWADFDVKVVGALIGGAAGMGLDAIARRRWSPPRPSETTSRPAVAPRPPAPRRPPPPARGEGKSDVRDHEPADPA